MAARGRGLSGLGRTTLLVVTALQLAFVAACYYVYLLDCPLPQAQHPSTIGHRELLRGPGAVVGNPPQARAAGPTIFVVTPTYDRRTQKLDLTRLSHTLRVASRRHDVHWIVVEDATSRSALVASLLARSGLVCTHLHKKEAHLAHHFKAGEPRNEAIRFIRALPGEQVPPGSVVYFAGASMDQ